MNFRKLILENKILSHLFFNFYGNFIWYANKLTNYYFERKRFKKNVGYKLNLKTPHSFNEKIIWKKINDRNPLLTRTADKLEVRKFIKEILGEKEANKILIPLLYFTNSPNKIPFDKFPRNFVVKSTHGSGRNLIINENKDDNKIIKICKTYLKTAYGLDKIEWAYKNVKRNIIIEKMIKDSDGKLPKDYKFFIFHGKCKFIQVDLDRFENHTRSLFDEKWNYINGSLKFTQGKKLIKPIQFKKMKELAEKIGSKFDFVRVDLYNIKTQIYFGELTHYPGSGNEKFTPQSLDFELGKMWKIK